MKRLAAGNMGYGSTFYPDEPEDLAYLKQLAKETRGDENRWPELNLRIHGRPALCDGEPCSHPGCLSHISHPCEGCGRVGGRRVPCDEILQCCGKCGKIPEAHHKDKYGDLWCVGNVNEAYEPVLIEYPGECKR